MNPFSIDPQLIPHPHSIEKMNKKKRKKLQSKTWATCSAGMRPSPLTDKK